jgi:hypothetical protein
MSDYSGLTLEEQLMNQLEEMQTEIDQYKQTVSEQQQQIDNLQGEVSRKDSQALEAIEQAEKFSRELDRVQSELANEKKKSSIALSNLEQLNSQLEQARQSANSSEVSQLKEAVNQLRSDNRKKSETIKSLNERIGKLSESDNVLKQNEKLKQKNSELQRSEQNARKEAEDTVSTVKQEYARKTAELDRKIGQAEQRESEAKALQADLSHVTDEKAQNLVKSKITALEGKYEAERANLQAEYKAMTVSHEGFLLGCLLYGVLVTLFTAIRSKAFVSDFKAFFVAIGNFLILCGQTLYEGAGTVAGLADKIPQPIVATILHWLLFLLLLVGLPVLCGIGIFAGINLWWCWWTDKQADLVALSVFLVSLALIIFFADVIKAFLPVNLLFLLLLVQIAGMGIRAYIQACKRNRGYY